MYPSILEAYADLNTSLQDPGTNCLSTAFIRERTLTVVSFLMDIVLYLGIDVFRVGSRWGIQDQGTNVYILDTVVLNLIIADSGRDNPLNIEALRKMNVRDRVEEAFHVLIVRHYYSLSGYEEIAKTLSVVLIAVSNRVKGIIFLVSILKEKYNIRRRGLKTIIKKDYGRKSFGLKSISGYRNFKNCL